MCQISLFLAFTKSANAFTHAPTFTASKSNNQAYHSIHPSCLSNLSSKYSGEDKRALSRRQKMSNQSSLQAIPSGLEDMIFNTQNAASNLANTVINGDTSTLKSLPLLYTAGLLTSFSPCSLGLLPITVSYITTAANERRDKNTMLPTAAFALGLALVFTALGVSASILGGVFGGGGGDTLPSLVLAAFSSLVSVFMGLQLLELIEIPLPSLDLGLRSAVLEKGKQSDSLFDANGGLILENLSSSQVHDNDSDDFVETESADGFAVLLRTFLLGGTSALVASPCASPVLASLLAYLALASKSTSGNELVNGAVWMLSYTFGYSTPLLLVGATGGQALVNLQTMKSGDGMDLRSWITPITGGVLIIFGFNGFLVALLGDPSLAGLAPIIE